MLLTIKQFRTYILLATLILLFVNKNVFGQEDNLAFIQNKVNSFNEINLQEKVYVHTDKNFYVTGDILWFKLYVVDVATQQLLDLSKVAYVEILDKDNKAVSQLKIALTKGVGNGSAQLPITLNSGNYTIRAYTSLMKNYPPQFFFQKGISIINPLKNVGKPIVDSATYSIAFFPEGGNMVNGLQSNLAFKITDKFGRGTDGKGMIINEKNDTVALFQTLKFGMGHFKFLPVNKEQYTAKVFLSDGTVLTKALPLAENEGYVMLVTNNEKTDYIHLKVQVANAIKNEDVFLFAFSGNSVKHAFKSTLISGVAEFTIDKKSLGDGITRFTLFNNARQPVCERLYFIKPKHDDSIFIRTDAEQYATRKKVSVSLPNEAEGASLSNTLSMAVYRVDSLQKPDPSNIINYFLLTSDLKGTVEYPSFYFSNEEGSEEAADNLMLTQGWRRFRMEDVLKDESKNQYPLEYKGQIISAKVVDARTESPAKKDVLTFLSIPDTKYKLFVSKTDSNGFVQFDVKDFYGPAQIILQTTPQSDSMYQVKVMNPFAEKYMEPTLSFINISRQNEELLKEYSIGMQAANIYNPKSLQRFMLPAIKDTFPFYGAGVYNYNLDEFTRFATMEEVLREYVKPIYVSMKKGKLDMKIFNEDRKEFDDKNQLFTVNGIPFFDRSLIFSFDPHKFKSIDVIPKNYYFGSSVFSGIANFSTYENNMDNLELDPTLIIIDYEGLQLKREFYAPVYETPQQYKSRLPDFRTTLYWTPEIKDNATGQLETSFYTSDRKGKFIIVAEGFLNGKLVTTHHYFEVN